MATGLQGTYVANCLNVTTKVYSIVRRNSLEMLADARRARPTYLDLEDSFLLSKLVKFVVNRFEQ